MRIRRRPQGSLLQVQLALDPTTTTSTAPQTPQNAARSRGGWLGGAGEEGEASRRADLGHKSGVARRLALPQDDNVPVPVAVGCGVSMGARRRGGADDGHMRFGAVNGGGHHGSSEERDRATCTAGGGSGYQQQQAVAVKAAEQRVSPPSNGVLLPPTSPPTPSVAVKKVDDEARKAGSNKKRRGASPAVLLEGSRCSRVNGRGWRCSQPTLVGYSLCEHHLGKGRMRSAAAAAAARGRLGRTEHAAGASRVPVPAAPAPGPPHDAGGGTSPARC